MHISKIRIENFKSIYEQVELDFNDIKGFWKISGSVGSGKSSLGEAVLFGLFGTINGKNNGDLISWNKKHGLVELWCESKGHSIYIKRQLNAYGQSPMYVEIDGDEMIATNKRDIQSQLEAEYYDISRMSVELLCIISFNNFRSLATLNTADTKKFLDQVLGFYILSQYIDKCKELRGANQLSINNISHTISKIQSQIDKIKEISNIQKIEGDQKEVKQFIAELNSQLTELNKTYTSEIDKIQNEIVKKNRELASIKTLGSNKTKEIEFIEKGICPTCGAPIDQSQLGIKKQERDLFREQYKVISDDIKTIQESVVPIKTKFTNDVANIRTELDKNNRLFTQLQEQAKRLSINTAEISNLESQMEIEGESLRNHQLADQEWDLLYNILSNDVKSSILNSFIPLLNANILKYTQRLHLPYIISFNASFQCNIEKIGLNQNIALGSLSTGQMKTVNMSIILGLLGTIIGANKLNILFLDELISNTDKELSNEICSILRSTMKAGDTIFIISHIETDNKYYDGVIDIKLEKVNQYEDHSVIEIKKYDNIWLPKQNEDTVQ